MLGAKLAHPIVFARPPDGLRSPSARCAKLALAARNLRLASAARLRYARDATPETPNARFTRQRAAQRRPTTQPRRRHAALLRPGGAHLRPARLRAPPVRRLSRRLRRLAQARG